MKRILAVLAVVVGAVITAPAGASQWLSSSATQVNANTWSMLVGSQTVFARAYSTQTASAISATASSGLFTSAATQLSRFSGGFGIANNIVGDANEGSPPEHAVDNNEIFDVLVFELPLQGMDLEAFRLGWAHEGLYPCGTGCPNGHADVSVFFGGNNLGANFDFSTACFTGCANALQGPNFTELSTVANALVNGSTNVALANAPDNNVPQGIDILVPGTQSGRYLVMSGALGGTNDNFKLEMIKATGGRVPLPGTLALLGLGLFGLAAVRRRAAVA